MESQSGIVPEDDIMEYTFEADDVDNREEDADATSPLE